MQINQIDAEGDSALHYAVQLGDKEMVEYLLDRNADINIQTDTGRAPLHTAARYENIEIIQVLLNRGANLKIKDITGCSPLHISILYSVHLPIVQFLLDHGADINERRSKDTLLHLAIFQGNLELVKYLVSRGATVDEAASQLAEIFINSKGNGRAAKKNLLKTSISQETSLILLISKKID
ncbi:MAG: ankyrin repeat domain-containing protein [Candidatus Amoebophilus sp.]